MSSVVMEIERQEMPATREALVFAGKSVEYAESQINYIKSESKRHSAKQFLAALKTRILKNREGLLFAMAPKNVRIEQCYDLPHSDADSLWHYAVYRSRITPQQFKSFLATLPGSDWLTKHLK